MSSCTARVRIFEDDERELALEKGISVSIAPDWSIGGSQNMLDELRFANQVDDAEWGDVISAKMLVQMATKNPRRRSG